MSYVRRSAPPGGGGGAACRPEPLPGWRAQGALARGSTPRLAGLGQARGALPTSSRHSQQPRASPRSCNPPHRPASAARAHKRRATPRTCPLEQATKPLPVRHCCSSLCCCVMSCHVMSFVLPVGNEHLVGQRWAKPAAAIDRLSKSSEKERKKSAERRRQPRRPRGRARALGGDTGLPYPFARTSLQVRWPWRPILACGRGQQALCLGIRDRGRGWGTSISLASDGRSPP
jgi:hypothetical protein